jgi:hypothetical protein
MLSAPVWPDVAPLSETPGGYVGQTSPLTEKVPDFDGFSLACQT